MLKYFDHTVHLVDRQEQKNMKHIATVSDSESAP